MGQQPSLAMIHPGGKRATRQRGHVHCKLMAFSFQDPTIPCPNGPDCALESENFLFWRSSPLRSDHTASVGPRGDLVLGVYLGRGGLMASRAIPGIAARLLSVGLAREAGEAVLSILALGTANVRGLPS